MVLTSLYGSNTPSFSFWEPKWDSTPSLESSYSGCKAIDEYVVHGRGNRAELPTNQWYTPWDTQEMTALIDWIRAHNNKIEDVCKHVRFIGIDFNYHQIGRDRVLVRHRIYVPRTKVIATFGKDQAHGFGRIHCLWPVPFGWFLLKDL